MDITRTPSGSAIIKLGEGSSTQFAILQDLIGSVPSIGTFIRFDRPRTYGITDVETGNITLDPTEAKSGIVQLIRHNAGSEPTFGSQFVKMSSYTYTTGVVNYIYLEYVSPTEILVTASVAA